MVEVILYVSAAVTIGGIICAGISHTVAMLFDSDMADGLCTDSCVVACLSFIVFMLCGVIW